MTLRSKFVAILAILFLQVSNAQDSSKAEIPLNEHSRALQFQIGSNFTLNSFQGTTISYKYHLDTLTAIRFGLSLSLSTANQSQNVNSIDYDTLIGGNQGTSDRTGITIQFNAQKIWYQKTTTGILFFIGTGPVLALNRTSEHSQQGPTPIASGQDTYTSDYLTTTWSVGITGVAGVEWFASKTISLHAEYGIAFGYNWGKSKSTSDDLSGEHKSTLDATLESWQVSSNPVRFGVSVYF